MSHINRLGGNMDEANAECAAWDDDVADKKYESHMATLVEGVKKHAAANYEVGGWDYVVECYEDSDIREIVAGCTTVQSAILLVGEEVGYRDDMRKDIQAEADSCMSHDVSTLSTEEHNNYMHCTCQDADDVCDYHSYLSWMSDLVLSGPTCDDGGYKPILPPWSDYICYNQSGNIYGTYKGCYLSQAECENEIPF